MKRYILFISALVMLTLSTGFSRAANEELQITKPIDVIGTGGAGVAGYGRFGQVFVNPASLGVPGFKGFSILKVGAKINTDLFDLIEMASGGFDVTNITGEQWKAILGLKGALGVNGPLTLGYVGNGLGLMLYNDVDTKIVIKQATGLPYVDFGAFVDIGLTAGYGFEMPLPFSLGKYNKLYAGINLKYTVRAKHEDSRMSLMEAYDTVMTISEMQSGIMIGHNISSDVGFLLKMRDLSVGMVLRDWLSSGFSWNEYDTSMNKITNGTEIERTFFAPALDLGVSYKFKLVPYVFSDLKLYFDIVDSLDFSENYLLKLRMGAEATLLTVLKVRAGLYDGYPTLGLSLDIPLLKINFVYYTEELGTMPGQLPQANAMFDIQLMI